MQHRRSAWWLVPVAVLLAGAAPELTPEERVRQGNAAFEREDYEAALTAYTRAEEVITNPGLVATNMGAALYRLGRFDEAAQHYERSLEDATGVRRAAMLYNLGNCRLRQSAGRDADRLKHAIDCFGQALRHDGIEVHLRDDARHNLELAKLLWLKAKLAKSSKENPDNPESPENRTKEKPLLEKTDDTGPGTIGEKTKVDNREAESSREVTETSSQESTAPGQGTLPQIPDNAELTRLSPEDAREHLRRATERILRERREYQRRTAPQAARYLRDY
jgi:tetratricopeptide (TPR) repeat protein